MLSGLKKTPIFIYFTTQEFSYSLKCPRISAAPVVTRPPPSEYMAQQGETIIIECEAIGVPTPFIVWRLNWGHIGAPPRVSTKNEKVPDRSGGRRMVGLGTLTIRESRKEGEGAYTCEALNSRGSIFATPDVIVHVLRECSSTLLHSR